MYKAILLGIFKNKPFTGVLDISYKGKIHSFGSGMQEKVTIDVTDKRFFEKVIRYGDIGLGEAYFLGYFTTSDLERLLMWFIDNGSHLPSFPDSKVFSYSIHRGKIFSKLAHFLNKNTKSGSKKNISKHYDISNDFYALRLDPTMTYSSAFFEPGMSLQQAQENKYKKMCDKLALIPGDHLLEIGTGWGGLSIYAAKHYGCKITTVTISKEQYDFANERVKKEGLDNLIDLKLQDYRDIKGSYDKIISIEMMEALGHEYVPTYIKKCESLLNVGGKICYQIITMPDEHFATYLNNQDYIQKHIFPGGELLSVGQIENEVQETGTLELTSTEYFGQSYAQTLHAWLKTFKEKRKELLSMGLGDIFIRKWEYYFIYCAVGFTTEYINVAQLLITKK